MNLKIKKMENISSKMETILFCASYTFFMMDTMFSQIENFDIIFTILNYSSLFMLGLIFFKHCKEYKRKDFILVFLVGLILFINFIVADHNTTFVRLFLLILAFKNINFNKFIKYDLIIKVICCIVVIVLCRVGFIENVLWYRDNGVRQSLGFGHSNTLGFAMLSICFSYVYIRYLNFNIKDTIVSISIFAYMMYFSRSRTAEIGFILLFINLILLKFKDYVKEKNIKMSLIINKTLYYFKKVIPFIPIIVFAINMTLVLLYGENITILNKINTILSNRLYYSYVFWKDYGISLFGQKLYTLSHEEAAILNVNPRILDSSYLNLLLKHGLIIFIIFIILSYYSLKYLLKEKNKYKEILLVILIIYYILAMMEWYFNNVCFNPFLLYFALFIFNKNLGDETIETTE